MSHEEAWGHIETDEAKYIRDHDCDKDDFDPHKVLPKYKELSGWYAAINKAKGLLP